MVQPDWLAAFAATADTPEYIRPFTPAGEPPFRFLIWLAWMGCGGARPGFKSLRLRTSVAAR